MGRMAYRGGRSRSTRPVSKRPPSWVMYQPNEVKALIIKLAREGKSMSVIGNELRDSHGIPLVKPIVGYGVEQVLKEAGLSPKIPEDLFNLMRRAVRLRRHMDRHRKDFSSKRGLQLVESNIYRLTRYYKRKGVLNPDWDYRSEIITV